MDLVNLISSLSAVASAIAAIIALHIANSNYKKENNN